MRDKTLLHQTDSQFEVKKDIQFLPPRDKIYALNESWSLGSLDIGDTQSEMNEAFWHCYLEGKKVIVEREDKQKRYEVFTITQQGKVVELDFTFDQNMRPVVVFSMANGNSYMYIYGTSDFEVKKLPDEIIGPKVCLDNTHRNNIPTSDIILGYTTPDNKLCYRVQRETFSTERVIDTSTTSRYLHKIGRTVDGKFAFQWR